MDLSTKGVKKFWKNYKDSTIYKTILIMENFEKSIFKKSLSIEKYLLILANKINEINEINFIKLKFKKDLIFILSHINIGKCLRILHFLNSIDSKFTENILIYSKKKRNEYNFINFFLERNLIFEKIRMLTRIFSNKRFNLIIKSIENEI